MAPVPPVPQTQSRIKLIQRPPADISPDITSGKGHFLLERDAPLNPSEQLKPGECWVKVEWVSLDPAMRGWLNDTRSYIEPVQIGATMRAGAVGILARTSDDKETQQALERKGLRAGDWVSVLGGWQEWAKVSVRELQKINVTDKVLPTYYLGALGMPGQTAYWGLMDVCQIKSGETIVVTGAAGAVGSVACQIAKVKGLKVIAIAGGQDKCDWLKNEIGVDVALDYKNPDFRKQFRKCGYVDCVFENVGGDIMDLMLGSLKKHARIALCGAISAYNSKSPSGLKAYMNLISQSAKIQGFVVFDYAKRYREADKDLAEWVTDGRLKIREHRLIGLDQCVEGLLGLFKGANTGKMVVKVGSDGPKL